MEPIKSYLSKEAWKRDWEKTKSHAQTFGRMLYDFLDGGYTASANEYKQAFLDFLDNIERKSIAWQKQLAREGKVFTAQGEVVIVRPNLAYPHIYATPPSQPLETRINQVNDLYR